MEEMCLGLFLEILERIFIILGHALQVGQWNRPKGEGKLEGLLRENGVLSQRVVQVLDVVNKELRKITEI